MYERSEDRSNNTLHRASYLLERGIWRATCQECGHQVADAQRRQAATQFRQHIQAARIAVQRRAAEVTIDLRDHVAPPPLRAPTRQQGAS